MNVLALVPSWNSTPLKCKDKERESGELWSRFKRCQDLFAAALTTRDAEASGGIPKKDVCSCRAWEVSGGWEERTEAEM